MADRPSWERAKHELEILKALVEDAIKTGKDVEGPLSDTEMELAIKARDAINAATTMIGACPQLLSPYRR